MNINQQLIKEFSLKEYQVTNVISLIDDALQAQSPDCSCA